MVLNSKNIDKKKVLVLGAFDLIHPGHIYFLKKAKEQGDFLIVGLFDDLLVKKLKGDKRPIIPYSERENILLSFESVDLVLPIHSIKKYFSELSVDILVKGEDDNFLPKEFITNFEGEIYKIEKLKEYSTSAIIKKIISSEQCF